MRGPQYHGYRERRRARRLALSLPWYTGRSSGSSSRSGEDDEQQPGVNGGSGKMMHLDGVRNNSQNMTVMEMGTGPRFGDDLTSDVVLHLKSASGEREDEEGVPEIVSTLYLHSSALRKSEFFEARLSERWSSNAAAGCSSNNNPLQVGNNNVVELTIDKCKDPQTYIRCIQLLYVPNRVKHTCFVDIQDALNILEVAAELLFHDCVVACMRYLESVPWPPGQESVIRSCVSNLHLQPSEDLRARLCEPEGIHDVKPVDIMQGVLGELLTLVTNGAPSKAREITERVLLANVQSSTSSAFANVNEVVLFKELQGNLEILKVQLRKFANFFSWNGHQLNVACSALRWILDELFTLHIADEAVRMFSEEKELAQLMVLRIYQNPFTETLFFILVRMLQALQKGEVLSPRSVRLTLLTTWLPVVAKLGNDNDSFGHEETQKNLEDGLGAVVETLPMVDQEIIFRIWIGACLKSRRSWPDLSEAFELWCNKLRQAHRETDLEKATIEVLERGESSCSEAWSKRKLKFVTLK
ncbi:hypothetical protein R1sor_020625 [Riccia sorocarpa]|uniref:At3g05675-like ankyrin-like domain-containing protein n=1 Tax=Riccia sorocarpa TaxID=122646 RepID=A0ABD3GGU4_9MARC